MISNLDKLQEEVKTLNQKASCKDNNQEQNAKGKQVLLVKGSETDIRI